MSATTLIKCAYINFPFYATRSEAAKNILTKEELGKKTESKPTGNKTVLFTAG